MSTVILKLFKLQNKVRLLGNFNGISTNTSLSVKLKNHLSMAVQEPKTVFQGTEDRFKGILVDTSKENCTIQTVQQRLVDSLKQWKSTEKKGIWFKIDLEHSEWVPILAKNGFDFHHAKNGYVMMYKWLPDTLSGIPSYAHTMLGVGALVTNENNEILAVKEKNYLRGHWKFPGGSVEPGEDLVDAAIRELKEETNIDAEFQSLVTIMHAEKAQFGCSDIYIVMSMKAINTDIKICEREIAACAWMGIEDYLKRDDVTDFNKKLVEKYLEYKQNEVQIGVVKGFHELSKRNYVTYSIDFKKS